MAGDVMVEEERATRATGASFSVFVAAILVLTGCSKPPPLSIDSFDADAAYRHVESLVNFGPRPPGTEEHRQTGDYIAEQLRQSGLEVEDQRFHASTPRGPMEFRNIIGRTGHRRNADDKILIFASHYDTKWIAGIRFVGANDSGSSTGVLLEMARVAASQPNIWFVFFDGEEAFNSYGPNDGFWGSKFVAADLVANGEAQHIKAMVLLDMVGDKNLTITLPANSTGHLSQQVLLAARELGYRDHFRVVPHEIGDDHVAFIGAGIAAVDLIDFEYGSAPGRHDYWHTEHDTLDKISPSSLKIVGQTALHLIDLLRR